MIPATLPASILDRVLGLALSPAAPDAGNRVSIEGLAFGPGQDGATELRILRFEASALRLSSGPFTLEIGKLALHQLAAQVRTEGGRPRLHAANAASAEFSGVKAYGPLALPPPPGPATHVVHVHGATPASSPGASAPATSWSLAPLAAAEGTLRAEIVDAHLLFDADVTVPIRQGLVEFRDATVEHVGPDSRMGASRLGIYVDAPNGRSYLYQFASAPVAGVEYERRGAMLGPWVTDRGRLHLQPFGEWLLRQLAGGQALGVTEQARLLFDRTRVSGEVRLGDGRFAAPWLQAELAGRAEGRNAVRLHSVAVGRELDVEMGALSARNVVLGSGPTRARCDEITGALTLRVFVDAGQLRFAFELGQVRMAGLHLQRQPAQPA
ncbi:MAG TPA: hypothetical protein VGD76_02460 [Ramlibacter sp.]